MITRSTINEKQLPRICNEFQAVYGGDPSTVGHADPPEYSEAAPVSSASQSDPLQPSDTMVTPSTATLSSPSPSTRRASSPSPSVSSSSSSSSISSQSETPKQRKSSNGVKIFKAIGTGFLALTVPPVLIAVAASAVVVYGTGKIVEGVGRGMAVGPELMYKGYKTKPVQRLLGNGGKKKKRGRKNGVVPVED